MREFKVKDAEHLRESWPAIKSAMLAGLEAGILSLVLQRPSKTRAQERLAHSQIADIVKTAKISIGGLIVDFASYGAEANSVAKALFVRWFEIEMATAGTPLRRAGRVIIDPMDGSKLQIRPSTTQFSVGEYSNFIEYLYALGAQYGVTFSDKTLAWYEELANGKQ